MRPRQVTGASAPGSRNPIDMAGSPWFVSGMRAPPEAKPSSSHRGKGESEERTGRQTGFSGRFETKELGNRRTEDVKVKHADACAVLGGEGEGEVHLGEIRMGVATGRVSYERYITEERTNQRPCSFPRRLCHWQRRRPSSRSVCRALAGDRDAASLEVHLASEVPERRSELAHAVCDKGKCYDTSGLSWRKVRRVLKSRRAPGIMMDGRV